MSTGELKYRVSAFISILVLKISSLILTELGHSADLITGVTSAPIEPILL